MAAPGPRTLAFDIGGTGLKAEVLDAAGQPVGDRARVDTTYPMSPQDMLEALAGLAAQLPGYHRISAGFPGVVRENRVLTAPHFVTVAGPGTAVDPELEKAWSGFPLGEELGRRLAAPARVANDADLQGAAVIKGVGLELVVTLGTGVGTGLFYRGILAPHLEIAHHPLRKGETYNEQLGEAARKRIGNRKWNKRVRLAIDALRGLVLYDRLYIGGGNSARIAFELRDDEEIVDNSAGLLGGIRLWEGLGDWPAPVSPGPAGSVPTGDAVPGAPAAGAGRDADRQRPSRDVEEPEADGVAPRAVETTRAVEARTAAAAGRFRRWSRNR